jgi:hypothetical protein
MFHRRNVDFCRRDGGQSCLATFLKLDGDVYSLRLHQCFRLEAATALKETFRESVVSILYHSTILEAP